MSVRSLQIIVGKAVISDSFRVGILNGRRAELLREFDLEPEETAQVMAIQAGDLAEFAAAVENIVRAHPAPARRRGAAEPGDHRLAGWSPSGSFLRA